MTDADASNEPTETPTQNDDPSTRSTLLEFLLVHGFKLIALLCLLGAAAFAFGWVPTIGRELKLGLLTFGIALFPSSIVADRLMAWVPEPTYIWIVDVDARVVDGAIYRFPQTDFTDLEVTDGSLEQWGPILYAGSNVDLENMTAEGTWRGTLDDRQLIASLQAVYECRDMLEEDAQRAFALDNSLWSIVRKATKAATASVIKTFEKGSLPDEGDGINTAVNDALDQFGLERRYSGDSDTLEDLDVDMDELGDVLDRVDADDLEDQDETNSDQDDGRGDRRALPGVTSDDD